MVRKMPPLTALQTLEFTNKAAAKTLSKAIRTVLGNARQLSLDQEKLVFKKIEINEGPRMKRFRAGSRGRAKPYKKRMSQIKIVLTDELTLKKQNKKEGGKQTEVVK